MDDQTVAELYQQAFVWETLRGQTDQAAARYRELLQLEPHHVGALNNLASICYVSGAKAEARALYLRAIAAHPDHPQAHWLYASLLTNDGLFTEARGYYERAIELEPLNYKAHQGLSYVLLELGDPMLAAVHRERGFRGHAVGVHLYRGVGPGVQVLVLASSVGGLFPVDVLLDQHVFAITQVIPEYFDEPELPRADVVVNCIGDVDRSRESLESAIPLLAKSGLGVINLPEAVLETSRHAIARRLSVLPGVVTPRVATYRRIELGVDAGRALQDDGWEFPLLVRVAGYHTGRHFLKVDEPSRVQAALDSLPDDQFLAIEHIDTRSTDRQFRKYRAMFIGGEVMPLHLAVSRDWKVHYFSAQTANDASLRDEEALYLADPATAIGSSAFAALSAIARTLALDYAGIDFALDAQGRVVVFEANATMAIPRPSTDPVQAYRTPAIERIVFAFRKLVVDRAFGLR